MAEIIIMPKLGFNMSVGKLVTWYKKEGDMVTKGEPVFAVETNQHRYRSNPGRCIQKEIY
mgnify:CR=1 FL=1